jgi:hypothetical protein
MRIIWWYDLYCSELDAVKSARLNDIPDNLFNPFTYFRLDLDTPALGKSTLLPLKNSGFFCLRHVSLGLLLVLSIRTFPFVSSDPALVP